MGYTVISTIRDDCRVLKAPEGVLGIALAMPGDTTRSQYRAGLDNYGQPGSETHNRRS